MCAQEKTKPDCSFTNDNQEKTEMLNGYIAIVFALEGSEALPDFQERKFTKPLTNVDINETNIEKATDKRKASKLQGHRSDSSKTNKRMERFPDYSKTYAKIRN